MYKLFFNDKTLLLSNTPENAERNIYFQSISSLEIALDLLENTPYRVVNVYNENVGKIWEAAGELLKIIEAAGGIVRNLENKFLFIFRLGKWDLPKGKIERGESPEIAAVREIEEETGIANLKIEKFIDCTYHIFVENGNYFLKKTHWFSMNYEGSCEPVPQKEEGISQAKWIPENMIIKEIFPQTFENIKLIISTFILQNLKI